MDILYCREMNVPPLPSREQERPAGGVSQLMLGARVRLWVSQLDDAPATWLS